jgi:hypothetical protein
MMVPCGPKYVIIIIIIIIISLALQPPIWALAYLHETLRFTSVF